METPGEPNPNALYQVMSQNHVTKIDEHGHVVEGVQIHFRIPDTQGQGTVFVAGNPPSVEAAQSAMRDYANNHLAIHQLSD